MNSSQFMDKQIMGPSGPQSGGELFDLMNPQEDQQIDGGGIMKKEEILPSYDFQPIRTVGSSTPMNTAGLDGARPSWGSADSKLSSASLKYAGILDTHESSKVGHEKEKGTHDGAIVAEIDRTVKKYADNLLNALEGVSSRLSQLENRTRHLENSMDELKVTIGNNTGSTDGKLRQLENILREVQTGMQVLRDKQDIAEAQLQLSKLQAAKGETTETSKHGNLDSQQQPASPQQSIQQPHQPPAVPPPPPLPAVPSPNAPPTPPQPSGQHAPQLPPSQVPLPSLPRETYFVPPTQQPETVPQHYQIPSHQPQPPPPPQPQPQHYQSPSQPPQYSQTTPPSQPINPSPQLQPPMPHLPEESAPYMPPPPQSYPLSIRQPPPVSQSPSGPPPSHQFYGPNPAMYEPTPSRPSSGQHSFSSGYGSSLGPGFSDVYPYSGAASHYNSAMKPSPFSSSAPSGGSSYPRLPTAQLLPQAQPTGSSSSCPMGNRVPIDDVVDKVVMMGFSRDQVKATVKKLTENGQSVDLNVVLDKLMNDGEIQPQKGWFGR